MKMMLDLNRDTDSAIEIYDEETQVLERWFVSVDDILHYRREFRKEFGDANMILEGYF